MKATHEEQSVYYWIITQIVKGCAFDSFLELGIGSGVLSGMLRQHCPKLETIVGVDVSDGDDPHERVEWIRNTSTDEFFRTDSRTFDAIFVDADHMRPQATKDTINAMRRLNDDGLLFMHDTYPPNVESIHPMVCGDVFRTYLALAERNDLEVVTLPLFNGLTIARRVGTRRIWTVDV